MGCVSQGRVTESPSSEGTSLTDLRPRPVVRGTQLGAPPSVWGVTWLQGVEMPSTGTAEPGRSTHRWGSAETAGEDAGEEARGPLRGTR